MMNDALCTPGAERLAECPARRRGRVIQVDDAGSAMLGIAKA